MKTSLFLMLSVFCLTSFGQKKSYERDSAGKLIDTVPAYNITRTNHSDFLKRAEKMISLNDRDSSFEAYFLLKHLFWFDSTIYSRRFLSSRFSQIEKSRYDFYKKNIPGEWNFRWRGTNWGTTMTNKEKKARIFFTDSLASFYNADTLTAIRKYVITNKFPPYPDSKELFFQLFFPDNNEVWSINILMKGREYHARLGYSNQNVGLIVSEEQNCNYCSHTIYIKSLPETP